MDNMDNKMKIITEMLENPDTQDTLKNIIQSFSSNSSSSNLENIDGGEPENNTNAISDLTSSFLHSSRDNETRISLLNALQPFLNDNRKTQCSTCVNIVKIAGIAKILLNK